MTNTPDFNTLLDEIKVILNIFVNTENFLELQSTIDLLGFNITSISRDSYIIIELSNTYNTLYIENSSFDSYKSKTCKHSLTFNIHGYEFSFMKNNRNVINTYIYTRTPSKVPIIKENIELIKGIIKESGIKYISQNL